MVTLLINNGIKGSDHDMKIIDYNITQYTEIKYTGNYCVLEANNWITENDEELKNTIY